MKKIIGLTAAALTTTILAASAAYADLALTQGADVNIIVPLAGTEDVPLNFGTVVKPASGTETVIMALDGARTGTATVATGTNAAAGEFTITGSSTNTISIGIATSGTPTAGLALTNFVASYNNGALTPGATISATAQAAPGAGKDLLIAGTLEVASTVATGSLSTPYTVTVAYE